MYFNGFYSKLLVYGITGQIFGSLGWYSPQPAPKNFENKFTQLRHSLPGQAASATGPIHFRNYAITGARGSQGWCKFTSLPRNREECHVMDSQESRRTCEAHLLLWIPGMELCPPGEGLWLRNGLVYGIR